MSIIEQGSPTGDASRGAERRRRGLRRAGGERAKRRIGLSAAVGVGMFFAVAGPFASGASATHFRYGNLNWQKAGPATGTGQSVTFQNEQSWRWSYFGKPAVGTTISNPEGCISFGDGTSSCPQYRVTFVNAAEDYMIVHALAPGSTTDRNVPHTYSTLGSFTARTSSCCTISTLNNAHDMDWQVAAKLDLAADDESAKSTVPPIVQLPAGGVQTFTIPALDAGGETKRFRLSTNSESCVGCLDGQPPGLSIDSTTGQVTWDTTGRDTGSGLWWTGVVVESLVGGNVVSSTQIQYIIRVGGAASNASPVWDDAVTPEDGKVFTASPGDTITFDLKANDPDAADTVQILQNSGPGTLTPSNGNPATATFSYTATAADIGVDRTVQFIAQDNGSPPLGPPFRSYTLRVAASAKSTATSYTGNSSVQYSDAANLSAKLEDASVSPAVGVAGRQLDFELGTQTTSGGPTDAGGAASKSLTVTQKPGSVSSVKASFAGDSGYAASSDTKAFSITKEDCTVAYSGDLLVAPATNTKLAADFGEPDGSLGDRSDKTVTFSVTDTSGNVQTFTAKTDANGHAETSQPLGSNVYGVVAAFSGDDYYKSCATATDTLVTVQAAGSKVTGGGWISISTGRTNFGFNAIPEAGGLFKGQFQLRSNNGKNRFHANVVTTLSSSGGTATWSGTGKWNGLPDHRYKISVVDNGSSGSRKADTISITITKPSPDNTVVYSSGSSQTLRGGNITVH